jgi:hypothetical protein
MNSLALWIYRHMYYRTHMSMVSIPHGWDFHIFGREDWQGTFVPGALRPAEPGRTRKRPLPPPCRVALGWCRASASADTRAYLASDRTDAWGLILQRTFRALRMSTHHRPNSRRLLSRPASGCARGRRGLQCLVQGAGQRYLTVQPGQAEQLPGLRPRRSHAGWPVRGGAATAPTSAASPAESMTDHCYAGPTRDNDPLSLVSRPSSCGNTFAAKPDPCALSPIAELRFSMRGGLSPASVYWQVPDDAMPL